MPSGTPSLGWRVGVELELMAPPGRTRRDLAERLAGPGGSVEPFFSPQSEPSLVEGMKVFDSLTQGFRARDASGNEVASFVDDLTLRHGLDHRAAPEPDWYRIVSDDRRLLNLINRYGPADQGMRAAIQPTADLFGTKIRQEGPMLKVVDELGAPICIAAPLPGERHRACEIVTPPIDPHVPLQAVLDPLLQAARSMGFFIPGEAATHLHLESAALEQAPVFANLVLLLHTWGDALKQWVRTNPRCVRLGPIPDNLLAAVREPDFRSLPWPQARARLATLKLSKYVDYNVKNLAHPRADKPTFEVRVLPGAIASAPVVAAAQVFVALARCAVEGEVADEPPREDLAVLWERLGQFGELPEL